MLDSKKRFTKTIKYYDQYRPSYPQTLVNWIIKHTKLKPGSTVVDVGCGTGISTRLFTGRGFNVIGIDPNPDMLRAARKHHGASYKLGEATKTGIPKSSVDLIIMAQALHWFDIQPTLREFMRILKPNGYCCAFWNKRHNKSKFMQNYGLLVKTFSQDPTKTLTPDDNVQFIKSFSQTKSFSEKFFTNLQKCNQEALIGRAYSVSYIAHGVKNNQVFKQELSKLFTHHQRQGHITFYYHAQVVCWQFKK